MAVVVGAWPFVFGGGAWPSVGDRQLLPASPVAIGVWLLLLAVGAALLLMHRARFVAVVLTGAVGLVASLSFIAMSAPDLAMTRLSVDVVSTVLLLMGLALLPVLAARIRPLAPLARCRHRRGRRRRHRGADLADAEPRPDSISWYFLEQSLPRAAPAR